MRATKRTPKQLDQDIADFLVDETLTKIAKLPFPLAKILSVTINMADDVTEPFDSAISARHAAMVNLSTQKVRSIPQLQGTFRVPSCSAYVVAAYRSPYATSADLTITLRTIDPVALEVAIDAVLADKPTSMVSKIIGDALRGRKGLCRDAYIALATRMAKSRK